MLGSSSWLRTSPFHGEGHGFESRTEYKWEYRIAAIARHCKCLTDRFRRFESSYSHKKHDENRIESSCYYDTKRQYECALNDCCGEEGISLV